MCALITGLVALGRFVGIKCFTAAIIDNLVEMVGPADVTLPSTSAELLIEWQKPRGVLMHMWKKYKRLEHQ
ncbi:MAG: hypothetical protein VYE04_16335 [Pseudomonadota bacterium]|nr:hypothetical protein [Pseudomonadota bacterium]